MKNVILILSLLVFTSISFGQERNKIDSLLSELKNEANIARKIELVIAVGKLQSVFKDELVYAKYANQIATDAGNPDYLISTAQNLSRIYAKSDKDSI